MKRILLIALVLLLLTGCGEKPSSEETSFSDMANMTEEEKEAEIAEIFARIGVTLPENWSEMTKQERGRFILKYGLGK